MRMSRLLLRTQKSAAAEAELPSHRLILRAGLARQVSAGIYSLTPLALLAMRHIESIVREEMERIGGQETLLPVVQPAEIWQASGRYDKIDQSLLRFADRNGHPMVLAMTHEEAMTDLVRSVANSYKQLPLLLFQLQTKFRDEARPRGGLIRLREFQMKDAYSFHADTSDLDSCYDQVFAAYQTIFRRIGLPVLPVRSDSGLMGGQTAHEFMLLHAGGEDTLLICPVCHYAANQEVAQAQKQVGGADSKDQSGFAVCAKVAGDGDGSGRLPKRAACADAAPYEVHTPGVTTISELSAFLGCAPEQVLKSVFYQTKTKLILALVRGDLEISVVKLSNLVGETATGMSAQEASADGFVVGFAGPVGLQVHKPVVMVADDTVVAARGWITGANRPDYHLGGVVYGRDFTADCVGDIAQAGAGQPCICCGAALEERRGIEVANIFKLGTRYTRALGAVFTDAEGVSKPMVMGCYGIGITRLLACIIEQHHDDDGIVWPVSVAPYPFHLLVAGKSAEVQSTAESLYTAIGPNQVLCDDRELSIGVKLKDADLLGMPIRITISDRSILAGGIELQVRRTREKHIVPPQSAVEAVHQLLAAEQQRETVVEYESEVSCGNP